ncbi:MAG: restriction endonuclease subunit S [Bacillales bacterium]|jgi:type I restriction enzyme S subunit|nr:restriction endonuclease subunit S [Bacillales bacterium]
MIFKKLGSLVEIKTGKLDANAAHENGKYPFFTCSVTPLKINTFAFDQEAVLIAGNGDLNVKYYDGKFNAYQRTYVLSAISKELNIRYLYWFCLIYVDELRNKSIGGVIKYIKLGDISEAIIPLPSINNQIKIVEKLECFSNVIQNKNKILLKFKELVKSQFIEMFDAVVYSKKQISDVALLKSGTTFSENLVFTEGEVNYSKVADMNLPENSKYMVKSSYFVSRKVAGSTIIPKWSIIFPKRGGAIGTNKKRITNKDTCIDLNTMAVIPTHINFQYLYQYFQNIDMNNLTNGSSVPQINNIDIYPLEIKVPPIELQNKFASIVEQVDKLKFISIKITNLLLQLVYYDKILVYHYEIRVENEF